MSGEPEINLHKNRNLLFSLYGEYKKFTGGKFSKIAEGQRGGEEFLIFSLEKTKFLPNFVRILNILIILPGGIQRGLLILKTW